MRWTQTQLICGTIILVACIMGFVYIVASGRPPEVAVAFMGPIVLAVTTACFNAIKLEKVERKVDQLDPEAAALKALDELEEERKQRLQGN